MTPSSALLLISGAVILSAYAFAFLKPPGSESKEPPMPLAVEAAHREWEEGK
jgi:hypothetical protein